MGAPGSLVTIETSQICQTFAVRTLFLYSLILAFNKLSITNLSIYIETERLYLDAAVLVRGFAS